MSQQCQGVKRYALRCQRLTAHPSGLCYQHQHQEERLIKAGLMEKRK